MNAETIDIRPLEESDEDAWERYVRGHDHGTVFHRPAWSRAVRNAYGHRDLHVGAWSAGRMVGVLPLFLVKSIFVGSVLISVPYATYGGILAGSDEIATKLLAAAENLSRDFNCQYLELRHRETNSLGLTEVGAYDTFRKELPATAEEILPSLPRKTRAAARKGLKLLTVEFGHDLLDTVYDLYTITLRRLGSPNYRRRFFHELQRTFGDDCVCLAVMDDSVPVAGVISYVFGDEIVPYFSGSLPDAMRKNANNVMYLKLMEYAVQRGLRNFDFNRTRRDNTGPHSFKRYHGFEPQPLHYQVSLNRARRTANLSPSNRKFALAVKIWKKMPLCLTRAAGQQITKWIP